MLTRGRRQDKCGSVEKHGKISAFCNRNALKSLSSGTSFFYNWICNIKLLKETKSRKNVVLCSVNVAHICVKLRENLHFCRGQEGMGFIGNLKYKILHLDPLEKEIWYTPKAFGVCPYSMWQNVVVLLQEELGKKFWFGCFYVHISWLYTGMNMENTVTSRKLGSEREWVLHEDRISSVLLRAQ